MRVKNRVDADRRESRLPQPAEVCEQMNGRDGIRVGIVLAGDIIPHVVVSDDVVVQPER